jgi:flavin-dependent dehydrogenase
MKEDKIHQAMQHLVIAANLLPEGSDFSSEKAAIKNILSKLENIAKKRIKRKEIQQTPASQFTEKLKSWISMDRPIDSWKKSLKALDKMSDENKKKIDELKSKGSDGPTDQTLWD